MKQAPKTVWNAALQEIECLANLRTRILNASINNDLAAWVTLLEACLMTFGPYLSEKEASAYTAELSEINKLPLTVLNNPNPLIRENNIRETRRARVRLVSLQSRVNRALIAAGLGIPIEEIDRLFTRLTGSYKE